VETLRRSVPLWRSDFQCSADYDIKGAQCHNLTFNLWMPYSGTGSGRGYEEYRMRSAYSAALTTNYSFSEREEFCDTQEKIDFLKKYTEEYLRVRPYFSEDFYALTELSENDDVWCVMQFNRPEQGDGIVEAFRRKDAPYETASFLLKGLDGNADYLFSDADGGEFEIDGKALAENGLKITIPEKGKAKIYFYKKIRKANGKKNEIYN
ncbi:MAG: hypothetical protein ACI4S9_02570, partial [Christensenellales bacterium]